MPAAYPSWLAPHLCIRAGAGSHAGASANVKHNPPAPPGGVPRARLSILPSPGSAPAASRGCGLPRPSPSAAPSSTLPALLFPPSWGGLGRAVGRDGGRALPVVVLSHPLYHIPGTHFGPKSPTPVSFSSSKELLLPGGIGETLVMQFS